MEVSARIRDTSAQDHARNKQGSSARSSWVLGSAFGVIVILLAGWVVVGWSSSGRSFDGSRVRIAEVVRGDLIRDISADGRVIAANSPTLYAIAAGTVSLRVVAGDQVDLGQPLAVIDSPKLRSELVQEESTLASLRAEASRAALNAELAQLEARKALNQARIDQTFAHRDLERFQRAFEGGAVAHNVLAKAQDEVQKAEFGLETAKEAYKLQTKGVGLDVRNKQLLADRQSSVVGELQRQVDALTLKAPFDGQVGYVQVAHGTNVVANGPVLSVVDLTEFEVEIKVPESFARDLGIGMPAQVTSSGRSFAAELSAVSPEVVTGQVTARLRFSDGDHPTDLRQNQRLSARIVMDTRRDVLMVERGPFLEQEGGHTAYVVSADGYAARRAIQTGTSSLNAVEIVTGLEVGERIVVSGTELFDHAERVLIN